VTATRIIDARVHARAALREPVPCPIRGISAATESRQLQHRPDDGKTADVRRVELTDGSQIAEEGDLYFT